MIGCGYDGGWRVSSSENRIDSWIGGYDSRLDR